eukprot:g5244.t1
MAFRPIYGSIADSPRRMDLPFYCQVAPAVCIRKNNRPLKILGLGRDKAFSAARHQKHHKWIARAVFEVNGRMSKRVNRKNDRLEKLRAKLKKRHASLADDFDYLLYYVIFLKDEKQQPSSFKQKKLGFP